MSDPLLRPRELADVFVEFLSTNLNRASSVREVAGMWSGYATEMHMTYFYRAVPYRAIVAMVDDTNGPWLEIRLTVSFMEFEEARQPCEYISGRDSRCWKAMAPRRMLDEFAPLFDRLDKSIYTRAKVLVNWHDKRVHVKLYSVDPAQPHVLVIFLVGFPDEDYDDRGAVALT